MSDAPKTHSLIDDLTIQHTVAGEGLPLLMLHGWGANIDLVWPLATRLVAHNMRVYVPDLPGFGGSDEPPQAWSVYEYAAFVKRYLQAQHLDRVYLWGHSFGGRLGLILASDPAPPVIKMVLSNSAGIRSKTPLIKQARLSTYKFVRDGLANVGAKGLSDALRKAYNQRYASTDYQQVSGIMRETFVKVVNDDLRSHAARVTVPTLLLWGDQDTDTPVADAHLLEQTIPNAGLHIYPGAGHYSYLDRLPETSRAMHLFFTQP